MRLEEDKAGKKFSKVLPDIFSNVFVSQEKENNLNEVLSL